MTPYELLDPSSVPAYIAGRPALAERLPPSEISRVREVSDGNMNLVFLVESRTRRGLVLKQSPPHVRVDPTWAVTPERNGIEANTLSAHRAVAPEHVPALYDTDEHRHVLAIEDLSDHRVWRSALNETLRFDGTAEDVGAYLARVAFGTSPFGLDPPAHKELQARATNPELRGITEDLTFTEPYIEHKHNSVPPGNEPDVAAFTRDPSVRDAVGRAKVAFMTHAEALIHGDLHTGSVLVRAATPDRPRSTRVFDAEFAFYGPVGFDLGVLWGNLTLAAARAKVIGAAEQTAWLLGLPSLLWEAFESCFRRLWPGRAGPRVSGDGTLDAYLDKVRADAAAFAGAETARRVIGFAKVSDLETLPLDQRIRAVRGALAAARVLLLANRDTQPATLFGQVGRHLSL